MTKENVVVLTLCGCVVVALCAGSLTFLARLGKQSSAVAAVTGSSNGIKAQGSRPANCHPDNFDHWQDMVREGADVSKPMPYWPIELMDLNLTRERNVHSAIGLIKNHSSSPVLNVTMEFRFTIGEINVQRSKAFLPKLEPGEVWKFKSDIYETGSIDSVFLTGIQGLTRKRL